ncbi:MAG: hypothetical protein R3C53_22975 [Pirellulaceae bacterium]
MSYRLHIYRGGVLIGYVNHDDQWPGESFEPTAEFSKVEHLFQSDRELCEKADQCLTEGKQEESEQWLEKADRAQDKIVEPGVRLETPDGSHGFSCDMLVIFEGRVCWR